jgi:hypothetical protein
VRIDPIENATEAERKWQGALGCLVSSGLTASQKFGRVYNGGVSQTADYLLHVDVKNLRTVDDGTRMAAGVLAGRASVGVEVGLTHVADGTRLMTETIDEKSLYGFGSDTSAENTTSTAIWAVSRAVVESSVSACFESRESASMDAGL